MKPFTTQGLFASLFPEFRESVFYSYAQNAKITMCSGRNCSEEAHTHSHMEQKSGFRRIYSERYAAHRVQISLHNIHFQ